jgi:hypothetical protein
MNWPRRPGVPLVSRPRVILSSQRLWLISWCAWVAFIISLLAVLVLSDEPSFPESCPFSRIRYLLTVNSGHWHEDVRPGTRGAHDVSNLVAARSQRVGNQ